MNNLLASLQIPIGYPLKKSLLIQWKRLLLILSLSGLSIITYFFIIVLSKITNNEFIQITAFIFFLIVIFIFVKSRTLFLLFFSKSIYASPENEKSGDNNNSYISKTDADFNIDNFDLFFESEPSMIEKGYFYRGDAFYKSKNFERAIEDYSKAIALKSNFMEAYLHRGIVYCELKEYLKAKDDFLKALKLNPGYSRLYYSLGMVYINLYDYNKATEYYTKAIQLETAINKKNFLNDIDNI